VTIGRIGDGLCLVVGFECVQHRALLIRRQQQGVVLDTLLLLYASSQSSCWKRVWRNAP
jgi:hypothetical protein